MVDTYRDTILTDAFVITSFAEVGKLNIQIVNGDREKNLNS